MLNPTGWVPLLTSPIDFFAKTGGLAPTVTLRKTKSVSSCRDRVSEIPKLSMVKVANLDVAGEGTGGFTVPGKPGNPRSVTFPGPIAIPPSLMSGAFEAGDINASRFQHIGSNSPIYAAASPFCPGPRAAGAHRWIAAVRR